MVLIGTLLKGGGQADVAGADVPEEDAKGVGVHTAVVLAREELGRHVDGCAHDAATHHGLRLAEAQVRDLAAVVAIKLEKEQDLLTKNRALDKL